jgi:hypothetical protein
MSVYLIASISICTVGWILFEVYMVEFHQSCLPVLIFQRTDP